MSEASEHARRSQAMTAMTGDEPLASLALFSTAIGRCGIAWKDETVLATHLPETDDAATAAQLARRVGTARMAISPQAIQRAIEAITALLEGVRVDLSFVACDFNKLDPFSVRVYEIARTIAPGETRTYGDLALTMGDKALAQAVGRALGRNPCPIIVPCHRVLGAGGRLTGFSASGGIETKLRMLTIEGVRIGEPPSLFDQLPVSLKPARRG